MSKAKYRYAISHAAEADLDDIWLYTSQQWSVEQADTYYKQLIDTIEALAERRLVWQKADHILPGYFKYQSNAHIIFFKLADDYIDIVRILHGRMDIQAHLVL